MKFQGKSIPFADLCCSISRFSTGVYYDISYKEKTQA